MSDYLTTLALRALSPPRSIWPRPAAHFESPMIVDGPLGEPSPAPAASRIGPGAPERGVAGRPTRVTGAGEMGGPADTTLRIPPQKPAVSRRGQQQEEEPNILRRAHVDDTEEGAPRHSRAVDLDRPSDDAGPTPEEVDLRAISTPAPEPEPELAIERTIKPAPPSDDHSRAAAEDVDGPVVDGNEDPDREVTPIASTPRPRSTSRSPRRPPRAEHDGGPHITVTIGRVEVTSPDRQPPPAHQEIQRPALGLADYLKQRERG